MSYFDNLSGRYLLRIRPYEIQSNRFWQAKGSFQMKTSPSNIKMNLWMIILNYFTHLISIILMLLKALPEKKRKDLGKLENYRPVSILNCFSKIYKIMFFEKFKPWINSFLSEYMAAYRGNLSFDKIIHRN